MSRQLGRYELLRPIGRGGMAEIWLGRRRGAGGIEKRVVIKRILRERVKDPRFLELFVREAQISMTLAHKNIVPMFDFGRIDDELFLVMEFIDGPNWATAMAEARKREERPDPALISHIMFEACQALDYAHGYRNDAGEAQRIAHRDVTPGNLLLSFTGEVKLGDFGLAAATAGISEGEGRSRGTPAYMAPEQARGGLVGPAADIYSLGLILREALTFERARVGTAKEQIAMAADSLPPLPEEVPEALRAICEKATSLEISDRFKSAQEMAQELDTFVLNTRASKRGDRRPMNARVADWLKVILPDGLKSGQKVTGKHDKNIAAITYLEHGLDEVLDEPDDATGRSMAATALDKPGDGSDETVSSEDKEEDTPAADVDAPPRRLVWVLAVAALGTGALLVGQALTGSDEQSSIADAALPTVIPVMDAMHLADGQPTDAALDITPDAAVAVSPDAAVVVAELPTKRRADASPPVANSVLRVSTTPWATVKVVGRPEHCDETPCRLRLPAGTYRVILANPVAGLKTTITVTVSADEPTLVHEVLRAAPR